MGKNKQNLSNQMFFFDICQIFFAYFRNIFLLSSELVWFSSRFASVSVRKDSLISYLGRVALK
jgi:hypothetical protein